MKRIVLLILCLVLAGVISVPGVFAHSVFLKNGKIIEGKIISDTDTIVKVRVGNKTRKIKRSEIIRTVYNNEYKSRVRIILMDGRTIKGHVVEESKTCYIIRKSLTSTRELRIEKKKVNGILKSDAGIVKKDETPQIEESAEFPGLKIWSDKKRYKAFEHIVVYFKNTPGGRHDWISVAKKDSKDDSYEAYYYINRKTEGSVNFRNGLPPGSYEVRVYLHWSQGSYKVSQRYPFKVRE